MFDNLFIYYFFPTIILSKVTHRLQQKWHDNWEGGDAHVKIKSRQNIEQIEMERGRNFRLAQKIKAQYHAKSLHRRDQTSKEQMRFGSCKREREKKKKGALIFPPQNQQMLVASIMPWPSPIARCQCPLYLPHYTKKKKKIAGFFIIFFIKQQEIKFLQVKKNCNYIRWWLVVVFYIDWLFLLLLSEFLLLTNGEWGTRQKKKGEWETGQMPSAGVYWIFRIGGPGVSTPVKPFTMYVCFIMAPLLISSYYTFRKKIK